MFTKIIEGESNVQIVHNKLMLSESTVLRVFFGIPVPEDNAIEYNKIILRNNPHLKHEVRWTRPGNHHITVRFIGNLAEQKIPILADLVEEALKDTKPFEIKLRHIAHFPAQHGKMVAAMIQRSEPLQLLYQAVDLVVTRTGIPSEHRPYLPHVTLYRVSNKQEVNQPKIQLGDQSLRVDTLILYQSVQIEKGSLYIPLRKFHL